MNKWCLFIYKWSREYSFIHKMASTLEFYHQYKPMTLTLQIGRWIIFRSLYFLNYWEGTIDPDHVCFNLRERPWLMHYFERWAKHIKGAFSIFIDHYPTMTISILDHPSMNLSSSCHLSLMEPSPQPLYSHLVSIANFTNQSSSHLKKQCIIPFK